jgi:hypothetical protein
MLRESDTYEHMLLLNGLVLFFELSDLDPLEELKEQSELNENVEVCSAFCYIHNPIMSKEEGLTLAHIS